MTREDIVQRLGHALSNRADVRLAVLFGSHARGTARPDSDVDVAVDAPGVDETRLCVELMDALGCDVDVVSLRTDSIPLMHSIVRDGIVVHEGRRGAGALWRSHTLATLEIDLPWFRRMAEAMVVGLAKREAEDRPRRLGRMVDRDLVQAKLAELQERIARVRDRCPATADVLGGDQDVFDLVSFNLMLAIQSCADIASHVIADEQWPAAKTLSEGFERLRDRGVLTAATTVGMKSAVVVRNIVAHGYSRADPAKIHAAATQGLAILQAFASEVSQWLLKGRDD